MDETKYMVSEAAKKLGIQANVLRHMENELNIDVKKDEAGRRWYSGKDLEFFEKVKQLKGKGFQLRTIKLIIPYVDRVAELSPDHMREFKQRVEICLGNYGENAKEILKKYYDAKCDRERLEKEEKQKEELTAVKKAENRGIRPVAVKKNEEASICERKETNLFKNEKNEQIRELMSNIMLDALEQNNVKLTMQLNEILTKSIANELEYQLRIKEEKEEQRFRNLDKALREKQQAVQQIAAAKDGKIKRSKFFRKNKIKI